MSDSYSADWPTVALGSLLTDVQPGFASGKHNSSGEGVPHFRPMNVSRDGRIDRTAVKYVDPHAGRPELRLRHGDVVFNNTNSPELVGKTALFEDRDEPAFSNHMTRLRVDTSQLDPGFLALRLHQAWQEGWFAAHCNNHVSQASIGRDVLRAFEIVLPPLQAQKAIQSLSQAVADLRVSATSHLAVARRSIARFRQAVLAAACSGRLTADWRDQHRATPMAQASPLSSVALKSSSGAPNTSELVEVPDTWAWWPIESITRDVIDYRGRTPPHASEGPIPHVRTTQIRNGRVDWNTDRFVTHEVYDAYMTRGMPQPGDVLFTMEAPMGEVGVVDRGSRFSIAQRILLLRPGDDVDGSFLALALQSQPVRHATELRATGSGVVGIAYKRLRSVEIPKPPLAEQREIVARVSALLEVADELMSRIGTAAKRVDRSSEAVLAKAFRGELSGQGTSGGDSQ